MNCGVCGKECSNRGNLTRHMRSPGKGYRAAHNIAKGLPRNARNYLDIDLIGRKQRWLRK